MSSAVSQLGYLGLEVSDVERWEQFATHVLGLELASGAPGEARLLRMDEHNYRFVLEAGSRDDVSYVGWQVRDEAALAAVAERLGSMGADVEWGGEELARARRVHRLFRVTDPAGLGVEVFTGPFVDNARPFRSPRGLRGFEADELGFGHVVLCVEDVEAALRFYREGLGLRTSDFIDLDIGTGEVVTAVFLHAGPRHHSLALVPVSAPKRLHHFMLEVKHMDDVGSTYDICREQNVPIASSLGRHTNDKMFSFYMESPSGFQIELGCGGVLVDDATWEIQRYDAPSLWGHRPG